MLQTNRAFPQANPAAANGRMVLASGQAQIMVAFVSLKPMAEDQDTRSTYWKKMKSVGIHMPSMLESQKSI